MFPSVKQAINSISYASKCHDSLVCYTDVWSVTQIYIDMQLAPCPHLIHEAGRLTGKTGGG